MKKINYRLTFILVSLFISIILCALSNYSKYCLFFGLLMLGITSALFAWYKYGDVKRREQEIAGLEKDLSEKDFKFANRAIKKEKKKLLQGFVGLSVFMTIVAFISLFA